MLTIAIIDRHPAARLGLSSLLRQHFGDIRLLLSGNGKTFHKTFPDAVPNLIILGFAHPRGASGLDALLQITLHQHPEKIIILDEDPDAEVIMTYLRANVKGYISKRKTTGEIVDCIKTALDGQMYIGLDTLELLIENFTVKIRGIVERQDDASSFD